MSGELAISRFLTRSWLVSVALYLTVIGAFIAIAIMSVSDILDHRRALTRTSAMLDQLQGRTARSVAGGQRAAEPAGTPFLEGSTLTVAGASLLQRVAGAVATVGGTVQSSQVDVLGAQAKDGFVGLLVSCEMEQPALQRLLYDLEAGMPFLFVDQLDVQVPQASSVDDTGNGRIRVMIGVSGQWQATR